MFTADIIADVVLPRLPTLPELFTFVLIESGGTPARSIGAGTNAGGGGFI